MTVLSAHTRSRKRHAVNTLETALIAAQELTSQSASPCAATFGLSQRLALDLQAGCQPSVVTDTCGDTFECRSANHLFRAGLGSRHHRIELTSLTAIVEGEPV